MITFIPTSAFSTKTTQIDQERAASSSAANRIRDLEAALEDSRRRLKEERRTKENFEDLLKALRGEIAQSSDERDNLRDEVVPQLQSRIEGLEAEAAEYQKLQYEAARMQQDLQSLQNRNSTLVNARRLQSDTQPQSSRFDTISEENSQEALPLSPGLTAGLTRSNSLARSAVKGGLTRTGSLTRPGSLTRSNSKNERLKNHSLIEWRTSNSSGMRFTKLSRVFLIGKRIKKGSMRRGSRLWRRKETMQCKLKHRAGRASRKRSRVCVSKLAISGGVPMMLSHKSGSARRVWVD